ncbi:hypothetical protein Tco_1029075 [Tanacetum coccineum]|uniref:Xylulose kinase-1 n=1 Tax=Tanacetum coccineum TaxID=301880 RepID=A0ABQ5G2F2_9ASTR
MAVLDSCPKHNMVAYLEKTEGNAEFHEIIDFIYVRFIFMLHYKHVKRGQDTKIPQSSSPPVKVGDEAVYKELGDKMEKAANTASSLEAKQDNEKTEGSEGFHQIIDFLTASHINYALTESPTIYASLIEQFWQTAALSTIEDGVMEITATIDGRVKTITEASIRRHLNLELLG